MRHVLVAVSGFTPQVVTETAWALLAQHGVPLAEAIVVTTVAGRARLSAEVLGPDGQWQHLCAEYAPAGRPLPLAVRVVAGPEGELEDIRTGTEHEAVRDTVFSLLHELTALPDTALHCSLAGGRKSMGYLLGAALQFFGRPADRLYHVLVTPAEIERPGVAFYFPPRIPVPVLAADAGGLRQPLQVCRGDRVVTLTTDQVGVELSEIPVCRVGRLVGFVAPGPYCDDLLAATQLAVDQWAQRTRDEYAATAQADAAVAFPELVGSSPALLAVRRRISLVAPTDITVLITGETGTGKELVARAIHRASGRRGPFVAQNCGAIPATLAESLLFGHERGAFTGATSRTAGLFERAAGGTLFLDEVNSLPLELQARFLRVLEERTVTRLGAASESPVDVRVVLASNTELAAEVAAGRFRADLLYRVSGYAIATPPLREHPEDIPTLAARFAQDYAARNRRPVPCFTPAALRALTDMDWPGNARQLRSVVETAAVSSGDTGVIDVASLSLAPLAAPRALVPPGTRAACEQEAFRNALLRALAAAGGSPSAAARVLGVHRTTVQRYMRRFGIAPGRPGGARS
jgi:CRISPR-associated protein (TIGR02584 family)